MLDSLTIGLMLTAALLHASWHALVKSGTDQIAVLAGMGLVAALVAACALPFVATPSASVWLIIAGSVGLHLGYKLGLAKSYGLGDLGQAYPLARGLVPLFATVIAFLFLGQQPSTFQMAGILIVSLGLMWLAVHSIRGGVDQRIFIAAAIAGLAVAGYSTVDAYGTRIAGDWVSFTAWLVFVDSGSFFVLIYLIKRDALWTELWTWRARTLASGLFGVTSFSVFLWALSRSPVGPVSALREASVLFATLIGMTFYREPRSWHRIGAAATIVLGLIVIAAMR
jgi:drug/metabolite transporter (DMT)-like permease